MKKPKIVRCRLHTGGKTVDELRKQYAGEGLTFRDYESLQRAFDLFDGVEIVLSPRDYGDWRAYRVCWWERDNKPMMNAVYELEQTHPAPQYKGNKEAFVKDWMAGRYSAGMTVVFSPEDVEELLVLQEEMDLPDPPAQEKGALPRWRQVKEKRERLKRGRRK